MTDAVPTADQIAIAVDLVAAEERLAGLNMWDLDAETIIAAQKARDAAYTRLLVACGHDTTKAGGPGVSLAWAAEKAAKAGR